MSGPFLNTGIFQTKITDNDLIGPKEELGVWRYEAGKVLRYVKSGALIPAGECVKADVTVTTAALFGAQVLQCSAATDMFLGIAETTLASLSFGWVTIFGPATGRVATAGNEVPGAAVGPSTNTGVLSVRNTSHWNAIAIAMQSGLSAGSAVFITDLG